MDEQLWALALVTVQKTNWEKLGLREPHICSQTHTHLWLLCVPFTTDLENYQMKTLEMGRQKSSREAVALTSLLDVNFLGITLLWPCFPGHTRLIQIPSELQGWVFQDMPGSLRYPLNCKAGTQEMCRGPGCACAQHHLETWAWGRPLMFWSFCEFIFQTHMSVLGRLDITYLTFVKDRAIWNSSSLFTLWVRDWNIRQQRHFLHTWGSDHHSN